MRKKTGFTLIELSIVLVIISLIVGGVLVGRDLIWQAEIRKTVSQYEQFNTAANTFRSKYNCLPGDCPKADMLGFNECPNAGVPCPNGDGDGVIGSCTAQNSCNDYVYITATENEFIDFWYHLSAAGLIPHAIHSYNWWNPPAPDVNGTYSVNAAGRSTPLAIVKPVFHFNFTPVGDMPSGWAVRADTPFVMNYVAAINIESWLPGHNLLLGTNAIPHAGGHVQGNNSGLYLVRDILAIDQKVDDGLPVTGKARGYGFANTIAGSTPFVEIYAGRGGASTRECTTNTTPPLYNLNQSSSLAHCGIVMRAAF